MQQNLHLAGVSVARAPTCQDELRGGNIRRPERYLAVSKNSWRCLVWRAILEYTGA